MVDLGYTENDVKIVTNLHILKHYEEDIICKKIQDVYNFFLNCGYQPAEIIKMTKNCLSIFGYNVSSIQNKIKEIIKLGFDRNDVYRMAKLHLQIYTLDLHRFSSRFLPIHL